MPRAHRAANPSPAGAAIRAGADGRTVQPPFAAAVDAGPNVAAANNTPAQKVRRLIRPVSQRPPSTTRAFLSYELPDNLELTTTTYSAGSGQLSVVSDLG